MAASVTFQGSDSSTSGLSTYTFSSQPFGSAASDRLVLVTIGARFLGSSGASISSVTIGGVAATIAVQRTNTISNTNVAGIAVAVVPSGSTGTVVVNYSRSALRMGLGVYSATGADALTSDFDTATGSGPGDLSMALDIPAGGFAIGTGEIGGTYTSGSTWGGLTEDYDFSVATSASAGASDDFASAQTGLAVTWTPTASGSSTEPVSVVASFPSGSGPTILRNRTASRGRLVAA